MGILQSLFGGSSADNKNNAYLKSALGGVLGSTGQTNSLLMSLLGMGDPAAGQAGFDNYKKNAGFDFMLGEGLKGISGGMAARGVLNSGAAGKAYMKFGQGLASQEYGNYIKSLLGLGEQGLQAGSILADTGKRSSEHTGGLGKFLGNIAGAVALSDARLKENITKVGETEGGIDIVTFTYTFDPETEHRGVLAQDVARKQPEALGPTVGGYMTVDYGKVR